MIDKLEIKEEQLNKRLEKLKLLEEEILSREKAIREKENARKQVLLRISSGLWNELAKWADEEYRSINGQIEYLLTECVNKRK